MNFKSIGFLVFLLGCVSSISHAQMAPVQPLSDDDVGGRGQFRLRFELADEDRPVRAITIRMPDGEGKTFYYMRYRIVNTPYAKDISPTNQNWTDSVRDSQNRFVPTYPVYTTIDVKAVSDVVDIDRSAAAIAAAEDWDAPRIFQEYHDIENPAVVAAIAHREGFHSVYELKDLLTRIGVPWQSVLDPQTGFPDYQQFKRHEQKYPEWSSMEAPILWGSSALQMRYDFKPQIRGNQVVLSSEPYTYLEDVDIRMPWGEIVHRDKGTPILVPFLGENGEPEILKDEQTGQPVVRRDRYGRVIYFRRNGARVPMLLETGELAIDPVTSEQLWQPVYEFRNEVLRKPAYETTTVTYYDNIIANDRNMRVDNRGVPQGRSNTITENVIQKFPTIMGSVSQGGRLVGHQWSTLECVAIFGATDRRWNKLTVTVRGLVSSVVSIDLTPWEQEENLVVEVARTGDAFYRDEDPILLQEISWERQAPTEMQGEGRR
ncbi:MAG: hypothetical protein NUW37_09495 [Planctomycetes bacterium]|nr:hypothetical protein [Planctomycetota bacterium]